MNLDEMRGFVDEVEAASLTRLMDRAGSGVRAALEHALAHRELTREEGLLLFTAQDDDLRATVKCADLARAEEVGDEVTYVVNRNLNFTNICFVGCQFCGFKRQKWESDAYDHSDETIRGKIADAVARGATEVCIQGGINPEMPAFKYRDILDTIKREFPTIHIHAFSPMEIMYGSRRTNMPYPEYIGMLREHGLGSIPGTAAEILDDDIREVLSHKKVDVATWVEIITTAHGLGIPTTSTIMYGHLERPYHVINHLSLLREIQKRTQGFTEFVPLRFIHENTVLFRKGLVDPPPLGTLDLQMYAFSRLFLRGQIKNLQTSWVKLGVDCAAVTLKAGCNDFSGTLMEESITAQAGGTSGEFVPVDLIEEKAREMGRVAVERSTTYQKFYGKRAPNGARPRSQSLSSPDHHACGGVGAARFLRGLVRRVEPSRLTVIVNTADDEEFYGLHVSPDLDTITYTLGEVVNRELGWGLTKESFRTLAALGRFYGKPWFNLGDRDLATHLYRSERLRAGAPLARITSEIAQRFGVKARILPMSNDRVRTHVQVKGRGPQPFQEYFVRGRARGRVEGIELCGVAAARPAPGVLAALRGARAVIMAPSNPFVSLEPILRLPGIRATLSRRRDRVAAISPIVGGRAVKGPLATMMRGLGHHVSPLGIARLYRDCAGLMVIDRCDHRYLEPIRALGLRVVAADTWMTTAGRAARVAEVVLRELGV